MALWLALGLVPNVSDAVYAVYVFSGQHVGYVMLLASRGLSSSNGSKRT